MKDNINFLIKIRKKKRGINENLATKLLNNCKLLIDNNISFKELILDDEFVSIIIKLSPMLLVSKLSIVLSLAQKLQLQFPDYISEDITFEFYENHTDSKLMSEILLSTMFYMTMSLANLTNIINEVKQDLTKHKNISDIHFATLNKVGAYETHLMLDAIYNAFENNGLEKPNLYYNVTEH
jgi:hypothetical protein